MGIREIAAQHRQTIIGSSSFGCGESIQCLPDVGEPFTVKGVWSEIRTDVRNPVGIGSEGSISRTTLTIALSDAPGLNRGWRFKRIETGETWVVEQVTAQAKIGWVIELTRADRARLSGKR